ncbi:unnamed protein product [Calypogeia fissa]
MGNCVYKDRPPAAGCTQSSEALILVVGNDSEFKSRFARDLAEARGATKNYVDMAGVRVFTKTSEEPVVMDTTPLRTVKGTSRLDTARVWISQNSLRKLSGQVVLVVCCIASTNPTDEIYRTPKFEQNRFTWLHVLARAFDKNRKEIIILVDSMDSPDELSKQNLSQVLKRDGFKWQENIIFVSPSNGGGYLNSPIVKKILQSSVDRGNAEDDTRISTTIAAISPVRLPMVTWHDRNKDKFGPWGPDNVILFGMSGSGKSTLANMLTSGRLDGVGLKFPISSSVRGRTKKVTISQGRGWRVIDTPGLGEPNEDERSTISTDRAGKLIKDYVMLVQGVYCHFIYMWKKGRVTVSDTILWRIFNKMFYAEGSGKHMTIVVSSADQAWLEENIDHLKECFVGCDSFITVDFPPNDPDGDEELEMENQEIKLESLTLLEGYLASLCRRDLSCRLGMWSLATERSMLVRGEDKPFTLGADVRIGLSAAEPQPSDFELARAIIRIKTLMNRTFLPGQKLDLVPGMEVWSHYKIVRQMSFTNTAFVQDLVPGESLDLTGRKTSEEAGTPLGGSIELGTLDPGKPQIVGPGHLPNPDTTEIPETLETKSTSNLLMVFIGLIKENSGDGYFVSSKWLLRLQENERESLMSVLTGSGYSEACQTSTTTLFARFTDDVQYGITSTEASRTFSSNRRMGDDLQLARPALRAHKNAEIVNAEIAKVSSSDDPGKSSTSIDTRRQVPTWESFQAAVQSKILQSFCVRTEWLSDLKNHEKTTLDQALKDAGYEKISQTKDETWYERIQGQLGNISGAPGESSRLSNKNDVASGNANVDSSRLTNNVVSGNVKKSGKWKLFGCFRPQTSDSPGVASTGETRTIEGHDSPCRAQCLRIACSSALGSPRVLSADEHSGRQQYGDVYVTMLGNRHFRIASSIEKHFQMQTIRFSSEGRTREVPIDLKAIVETSLSCCLRVGDHTPKVRIKFSKICGQVRNKGPDTELCNAMVVSSLCTSVHASMRRDNHEGQIDLIVDEEYYSPPYRRTVIASGQHLGGNSDLVWLERSGRTPNDQEPGSTSLALRSDIEGRRREDVRQRAQGAHHDLLFHVPQHPIVFEGDIDGTIYPDSFLEFHLRFLLDISYYKPCGPIYEDGDVWHATDSREEIDFGCFFQINTENLSLL